MGARWPKQKASNRARGGAAYAGQLAPPPCQETFSRTCTTRCAQQVSCGPGCSSPARSTRPAHHRAVRLPVRAHREPCQEPCVVVQHRGHLRLLQHDFGQPNAIGFARALPGQAGAAIARPASAPPVGAPLAGEAHSCRRKNVVVLDLGRVFGQGHELLGQLQQVIVQALKLACRSISVMRSSRPVAAC